MNKDNLKAQLLETYNELLKLRYHKMLALHAIRQVEENLSSAVELTENLEIKSELNRQIDRCHEENEIEQILAEMSYLSCHISNTEKELNELGCYDY